MTNQDLVFALHAFALASVQLSQIFIYDRGTQGSINKLWIIFLIACYLAVFVDWGIDVFSHPLPNSANTILMMGYAKAAITFVKYLPQVYLNWKRQSTVGWSLENVMLDLTGGSLSLTQEILNSVALDKPFFEPGAFNAVKFMLSITSILFDSIFLFQHYVLYRGNRPKDEVKNIDEGETENEDGKGMLDGKQHAIAPTPSDMSST